MIGVIPASREIPLLRAEMVFAATTDMRSAIVLFSIVLLCASLGLLAAASPARANCCRLAGT
jgi:hypothetical protein